MYDHPILQVNHLQKQFGEGCSLCLEKDSRYLEKNYCTACGTVHAVRDVSFDLYPGEVLGIVGESGSGKSTMLQGLYFDNDMTAGEVHIHQPELAGQNVLTLSSQQKRYIRNYIYGMVYQNPVNGLKMKFSSIGNIAEKMIAAGNRRVSDIEIRSKELLENVHIPLRRMKEEPKNFSGGMQQRVQIAKALSNNPPFYY